MYYFNDNALTNDWQNNFNVVSGFPGIGKSYLVRSQGIFLDSDSSTFDKANFPANYLTHIKKSISEERVILASCHEPVRDALVAEGIPFILVYPDISLKDEYIARYIERGSPQGFIDFISSKWDDFIYDLGNQQGCNKIVLSSGEYLKDVISI